MVKVWHWGVIFIFLYRSFIFLFMGLRTFVWIWVLLLKQGRFFSFTLGLVPSCMFGFLPSFWKKGQRFWLHAVTQHLAPLHWLPARGWAVDFCFFPLLSWLFLWTVWHPSNLLLLEGPDTHEGLSVALLSATGWAELSSNLEIYFHAQFIPHW